MKHAQETPWYKHRAEIVFSELQDTAYTCFEQHANLHGRSLHDGTLPIQLYEPYQSITICFYQRCQRYHEEYVGMFV